MKQIIKYTALLFGLAVVLRIIYVVVEERKINEQRRLSLEDLVVEYSDASTDRLGITSVRSTKLPTNDIEIRILQYTWGAQTTIIKKSGSNWNIRQWRQPHFEKVDPSIVISGITAEKIATEFIRRGIVKLVSSNAQNSPRCGGGTDTSMYQLVVIQDSTFKTFSCEDPTTYQDLQNIPDLKQFADAAVWFEKELRKEPGTVQK